MKDWIKVSDSFFTRISDVGQLGIEETKVFDEKKKELVSVFTVVAFTRLGQRLPVPLFESGSFKDCSEFVNKLFLEEESEE